MTQAQETLFSLLRSALGTSVESIPEDFTDWKAVIDLAFEHAVPALSLDGYHAIFTRCKDGNPGVQKCLLEIDASLNVLKYEWFVSVLQEEEDYRQNWEVACKLSRLWASEGIRATVLKGRSIAQYYSNPSHRYSCDLDVFIPAGGDWEKACALLKAKGIKLDYEVYKEVEFTYKGVYVECHRYITPVRGNKNLLGFERYLRSLLSAGQSTFEGTSLINPPLMFTALLYVEHALGDFLIGPLTLKHLCDWMVIRKQPVNWPEILDGKTREPLLRCPREWLEI